jgi:hypothetical protein
VEVSGDGGVTWQEAQLRAPASPDGPTLWSCEWTPGSAGEHELLARAQDSAGDIQPLEPVWNELGYANNVVHRVRVSTR